MANDKSTIDDRQSTISAYPSDLTFHDLIAKNRRNSTLLVIGMGLLVIAVAVALGLLIMYTGRGPSPTGIALAAVAGLVVFGIAGGWSYFGGSKTLLRISGARQIEKPDDPQLFNIVDELRLAAGMPMPQVYLIDSPALNAFATGRSPEHAAVAITTGLRQKLTRDELAGVMAHEMAHVRHLDIRLTMLVATLVGLIVLAADVMLHSLRFGRFAGGGRRGGGKGGGAAVIVLLVIVVFLMVIAPLLAKLMQFAVSRQREYLADAGAVELTRYPQGLADALRKLSADTTKLEHANKATAHMYIVNPYLNARGRQNRSSAFATHPPMTERIARLEALMR